MPYLCGLWRFANAYISIIYRKEFAMTKDEHRSTVRVLSILLALSNTPDGMTLAELSQQLSAPKSSLFTIIHTMANQNFASYNEVTQKVQYWFKCLSDRRCLYGKHIIYLNGFRKK